MPVLIRIVLHAECKSDLWTLAIEFALDSRPLIITYFWWLQTAHCRQQPKYSIIVCPFQAYLQMFSIFVEWRTVWSTITFMMQLTRLHSRHNWYLITKSLNQKKKLSFYESSSSLRMVFVWWFLFACWTVNTILPLSSDNVLRCSCNCS